MDYPSLIIIILTLAFVIYGIAEVVRVYYSENRKSSKHLEDFETTCKSNQETCKTCCAYVNKDCCAKVEVVGSPYFGSPYILQYYYCKKCKPNYDKIDLCNLYQTKYYKSVEVDYKGNIIKTK